MRSKLLRGGTPINTHERLSAVERRTNISLEEFRERYAIPGIPVVIEDLADDWPARKLWTFDFFRQNYGDADVTVYFGPRKTKRRKMKLGEYLEYMLHTRDESPGYLSRWRFLSSFPELAACYERPPHFACWSDYLPQPVRPCWTRLYIGPPRTGSEMHIDFMGTGAWNVSFVGEKSWRFYPPDQTANVYDGEVNAFEPDLKRFPFFSRAEGMSCVQGPGDVLFTPSNWWHQVRNDSCTLALTDNFINETNGHFLYADPNDARECRLLKLLVQYAPAGEAALQSARAEAATRVMR